MENFPTKQAQASMCFQLATSVCSPVAEDNRSWHEHAEEIEEDHVQMEGGIGDLAVPSEGYPTLLRGNLLCPALSCTESNVRTPATAPADERDHTFCL